MATRDPEAKMTATKALEGDETPWRLSLREQKVRASRIDDSGEYLIRWAHEDPDQDSKVWWVDWAVYEVVGSHVNGDPDRRLYPLPNAMKSGDETEDIDAAAPLLAGFVKWDGCTQWDQLHSGHVDSRRNFEALWRAVEMARRVALTEFMANNADGNEYPEASP